MDEKNGKSAWFAIRYFYRVILACRWLGRFPKTAVVAKPRPADFVSEAVERPNEKTPSSKGRGGSARELRLIAT